MSLSLFLVCVLTTRYRWILDVYYPLTWVSKPKGQVLYVLSIMEFQCSTPQWLLNTVLLCSTFSVGFAVAWCYITPIACWWIANGYHPPDPHQAQDSSQVFQYSWTIAACLLAQIITRGCFLCHVLATESHVAQQ